MVATTGPTQGCGDWRKPFDAHIGALEVPLSAFHMVKWLHLYLWYDRCPQAEKAQAIHGILGRSRFDPSNNDRAAWEAGHLLLAIYSMVYLGIFWCGPQTKLLETVSYWTKLTKGALLEEMTEGILSDYPMLQVK